MYTPVEIKDVLHLPRGTTPTTLSQLHNNGFIGKTSDGLYHGFERQDDMRRFARSLVQLTDMIDRYSEPDLTTDDIEQTGTGVRREIPRNRTGTEEDQPREEPAPTDWVNSTVAPSTTDNNTDDGSNSASSDGE